MKWGDLKKNYMIFDALEGVKQQGGSPKPNPAELEKFRTAVEKRNWKWAILEDKRYIAFNSKKLDVRAGQCPHGAIPVDTDTYIVLK